MKKQERQQIKEQTSQRAKKHKGVTLVSLVVTIIVLIILAGISLNLTIGENGLFTMAKKAKENTELAQIEEQTRMNELYTQIEQEGYYDTPAIGELQDTIDSLNKNIEELESQLENERQERQKLQSQIEGLEVEVNNLKGDVSKANTQIQEKESQISELNKQIEQGQANIQENQSKIDSLENEITTLKQQVATNEATIQEKQNQIDDLKGRLTTIETSLANKEKQIKDLENKQDTLSTQVENLKTQIGQIQTQYTQLSNTLDDYTKKLDDLINGFDYYNYGATITKNVPYNYRKEFFTYTNNKNEDTLVSISVFAEASEEINGMVYIYVTDKTDSIYIAQTAEFVNSKEHPSIVCTFKAKSNHTYTVDGAQICGNVNANKNIFLQMISNINWTEAE